MEETLYHFVGFPQGSHSSYNLEDNPYSGYKCRSIRDAHNWAKILLLCNKLFDYVEYKNVNGRKVYSMTRKESNAPEKGRIYKGILFPDVKIKVTLVDKDDNLVMARILSGKDDGRRMDYYFDTFTDYYERF